MPEEYCSFLLLVQKNRGIPLCGMTSSTKLNEPKKKTPEMITSTCLSARYTGHKGATKQAEVRAISGLPSHLYLDFSLVPFFVSRQRKNKEINRNEIPGANRSRIVGRARRLRRTEPTLHGCQDTRFPDSLRVA
jgi:hypothetical protein